MNKNNFIVYKTQLLDLLFNLSRIILFGINLKKRKKVIFMENV
jgi:hypothetical protein